jgi:hypothetical protein
MPSVEGSDEGIYLSSAEDTRSDEIGSASKPLESPTEPENKPQLGSDAVDIAAADVEADDFHPGWRLWAVIIGLGVTLLLTALENTVVTVAAPAIVTELKLGDNYIWITNAFFICRYVLVVLFHTYLIFTVPSRLGNLEYFQSL